MNTQRIFKVADFLQPAEKEPIRSVITESADAVIVAWHVNPGQTIPAHIHPSGQDTWTILSGQGQYQIAATEASTPIGPGDVVVALRGDVHGVTNNGSEPLVFVSVVAPAASGFEPL